MPESGGGKLIAALLRIPYQAAMARVLARLREDFPDLRPAHLLIFQILEHPPAGSRLTDLAEQAQVTVQSMGELIDTLERRGYVERIPDPADRRAKRIRYTARGWAAHERGREIVIEIQAAWAGQLGEERFEHLLQLLRDLSERIEAGASHG